MVYSIIDGPVHVRPFCIRHKHVLRELWWSLQSDCMEWHLCIRFLVRACALFMLAGDFFLFSRQCGRLCFSRILRFGHLELLIGMVSINKMIMEWLLIKLVAIWFLDYRCHSGNAQFKASKLWVCYTNLGTLTERSAGHFQEAYVKQYIQFKLLLSLARKWLILDNSS